MHRARKKLTRGFTFVELIVGIAVFMIVIVGVYDSYTTVYHVVFAARAKIEAIDLGNEQLEMIRNLPYASVGISGGVPNGVLSHSQTITRDEYQYTVTTTVRNIDDPFDGTLGGTPNDTAPADYKLVEVDVNCIACQNFTPLSVVTIVAPKNLESSSTNGALFIKVLNSNGNIIPGAQVHIENNQTNPPIVIDDVTNNNGVLQIVDTPPGANAYQITVTKPGYSTDQTYASTVSNPNPTKPYATVLMQQVTSISFIIDPVSIFTVSSITNTCFPVPSIDFSLLGSKHIGTNPDILKYSQSLTTNSNGQLTLSNMEPDSYSFSMTDSSYDLIGLNPLSPTVLNSGSTQAVQLIVAPKKPNTLLVTVKDGSTSLPLSGVSVEITKGSFDTTSITGQGALTQTDWSGGSGQATSTDPTQYFSSDGNIDTATMPGDVILRNIFGDYVSNGTLISSSFDTGGSSNFQQIYWNPTDEPISVGVPNVRMQVATNNDGATWIFKGPDGTTGTFYTTANKNIDSSNNGNRYLRYKMFLDTATTTATPNISDVSFTFTSQCTPPGQISFQGLSSGTYNLHLTKSGYADQDVAVSVSAPWQNQDVVMIPN